MHKPEFIALVAEKCELSAAQTQKVLEATLDTITEAVANGTDVNFVGFGCFKPSTRVARVGRNPKTGESLNIPASTQPKFTAGANFKSAVKTKALS